MRQFAVIGLKRFGATIARTLSEKSHQVIAIDQNESLVQEVSDVVTQAICLDATDQKALKAIGIQDVDVAVCAIGSDLKASILVTLNLKELGIKEIVCKAQDEKHKVLLEKIGATMVVLPEREMGFRVANRLMAPSVVDHIELSADMSIADLKPPKDFFGHTLKEIDVRAKFDLNVIGIKRKISNVTQGGQVCESEKVNILPKADDIVGEDDILVVLGKNEDIEKFQKANK